MNIVPSKQTAINTMVDNRNLCGAVIPRIGSSKYFPRSMVGIFIFLGGASTIRRVVLKKGAASSFHGIDSTKSLVIVLSKV
jgi:hypothetical protein